MEDMMLFCKEPTCKSLAVVGGYCLSHQTERANELYAQLNQRNDSSARMSREITERIGNESRLTQRAEAAESTAAELRAQLATAQACITELESYIDKHNQRVLSAFERTAPIDWRSDYNVETPYGQMLDGLGDEVEP